MASNIIKLIIIAQRFQNSPDPDVSQNLRSTVGNGSLKVTRRTVISMNNTKPQKLRRVRPAHQFGSWCVGRTLPLLLGGLVLIVSGCADIGYYRQALSGQLNLLNLRRPVADVLADPDIQPQLRQRLQTASALRDFASSELKLPQNSSYRAYADLQQPYVVYNVFATPELSLEPRQWCFPIVGCVSYRGYFNEAAARRLADSLRTEGYDVYLGGVPAYSTLGWFDDPLLNTFVYWPSGRLAELVFHELAHQKIYIADDTVFNESFATFIGQLGARRWLQKYSTPEELVRYETFSCYREGFMALMLSAKDQLAALYASAQSDSAKRTGKHQILEDLKYRYQMLKQQVWDGFSGYDRWFAQDLNNAKLAALNVYTHDVPAFAALFEGVGGDLEAFYHAVKALGRLPLETRAQRLESLMTQTASPALFAEKRCSAECENTCPQNDQA